MKRAYAYLSLISLILLCWVEIASAIPLLSIDVDPATTGVQTERTVVIGSNFDVNVVYTGDGTATFDTAIFGVFFNDMGPVLGPGSAPIAGSLAGTAPVTAIDVFSSTSVTPGSPLTTVPAPLLSGFSAGTGAVGLSSAGPSFPTLGIGTTIDILRINLTANASGTSTISLAGVFNGPELALAGVAVPAQLNTGTIRVVTSIPVPEPQTGLLMALGGLLLAGLRLTMKGGQARSDSRG